MNTVSIFWKTFLTVAVAVLGYCQYNCSKSSNSSTGVVATTNGKSIVFVNVDSLLTHYDLYKEAMKEFENKRYRLGADLQKREQGLRGELAAAQQKAPLMTQAEAQATELQLGKRQQDYVTYRDQAMQRLGSEEQKKTSELIESIQTYIKKHNTENKYQFVLGYSKGGGILFANENLDVTQKILDGLNAEHKAKQAE